MIVLLVSVASAGAPTVLPPPYLDRSTVEQALGPVAALVAPCVPADAAAGLARVRVVLHGDGQVDALAVTQVPGQPSCWTDAIAGLDGPRHAGGPVSTSFALPYASGAVGTAVELELRAWTPDPIFLHVPGGLSDEELRRIRIALGLEATQR
ncbi:MAG: hypothetical protein VX265_00515 [Myxococcota bacterium]|nr:hypothetical protein [Myxococcota bacterium]